MVMGSLPEEFDVAIMGGGAAGYSAAIRASSLGLSVAVIEKDLIGGNCVNFACIPARAIRESVYSFFLAKSNKSIRGELELDWEEVIKRRDEVTNRIRGNIESAFKTLGIEVIKGEGVLSQGKIVAGGEEIRYKDAIIATGSVTNIPPTFGKSEKLLDYRGFYSLKKIPGSAIIVGGGQSGVEIATILGKAGVQTTIVSPDFLPGVDPDLSALAKKSLTDMGVKIVPKRANGFDGDKLIVEQEKIEGEKIIVTTGQKPNLPQGINELPVDELLRVSEHLYAIGDVVGNPMVASKAMKQGVIAAEIIAGQKVAFDQKAIPVSIFTEPEIVIVGSTVGDKVVFRTNTLGWSLATQSNAIVKLFHKDGVIKGVETAGRGASELAGEASLLIEMGAQLEDLSETLHSHPTLNEALMEASMLAQNRSVYSIRKK
ncbi:dihydrolipoamide dehydrogenase [Sulfolobales archaeon HS-7]|nr:dihydrolipoamide dehydrogenase [Sulfolobales archaeon HS-7]